jgi:nucleoside-diphosphate-sugar epimerase
MKILVIGATGLIGRHAAGALAAAGHEVHALQRPGGRPSPYPAVLGDLSDVDSLAAAAAGYDHVIQAAAPLGDAADLASATALVAGGSPVVYTTGAAVLGSGQSDEDSPPDPHPVAVGRPPLEQVVLAAGGRVIRPGLVYGADDSAVINLLRAKATAAGTGIYIGPPGVRWPVVHVADLADLYVAVVEHSAPGTIWHGTAETARLDEIAATLGGGTARSWPLADATAEIGPLADLFTRDQEASSAKTRRLLGWKPRHTAILSELG